jgi:hypothetical protein
MRAFSASLLGEAEGAWVLVDGWALLVGQSARPSGNI